jgi:hypothetical protein
MGFFREYFTEDEAGISSKIVAATVGLVLIVAAVIATFMGVERAPEILFELVSFTLLTLGVSVFQANKNKKL